jgi:hypothetical protein
VGLTGDTGQEDMLHFKAQVSQWVGAMRQDPYRTPLPFALPIYISLSLSNATAVMGLPPFLYAQKYQLLLLIYRCLCVYVFVCERVCAFMCARVYSQGADAVEAKPFNINNFHAIVRAFESGGSVEASSSTTPK